MTVAAAALCFARAVSRKAGLPPPSAESLMPPTSRPQPRAEILEIDAYVPGKAAPAGAGKTYKLSSNESPLGPPPRRTEAFAKPRARWRSTATARQGTAAGDRRAARLDPARLICGNGSDELIGLLAQAYLGARRRGALQPVGFVSYPIAIRAAGGTPVIAPERD